MRRNKFNLSYKHLLSANMGDLIPIGLLEVLPGDSIQHSTSALVRLAPMLAPMMHKVDIKIHHWFVPHRLTWDSFEDFITGGQLGTDTTVPPTITVNNTDIAVGVLADHLGVRPLTAGTFSALPFRAYSLIFNEFYRDPDLDVPFTISTGNGNDTTTNRNMARIRWDKDYFTTARPWEQKGPSVSVPIGTSDLLVYRTTNAPSWNAYQGGTNTLAANNPVTIAGGTGEVRNTTAGISLDPGITGGLRAQINAASTGVTIKNIRDALATQRFMEARARYGSRYPEYLRYLGVSPQDARLQRPEYLGGGRAPVQISEVLQTAEGSNPVGELRGHGIGGMRSNRYRRFIPEHGYIVSLAAIVPNAVYADGLERHWSRLTREDYWTKELEHIGQQEVLNKEVYMAHTTPNGVFGYQDRYMEYRGKMSRISGEFRTVLDHWHLARMFSSNPALNSTFVACLPQTDRTFAVPSQNIWYGMIKHSIQARRLVGSSAAPRAF